MIKKVFKQNLLILLFFAMFLTPALSIKAAEQYLCKSQTCGKTSKVAVSLDDNVKNQTFSLKQYSFNENKMVYSDRKLSDTLLYLIYPNANSSSRILAYCIEPGRSLVSNEATYVKMDYNTEAYQNPDINWNNTKKSLLLNVMGYVHGTYSNKNDYYQVIASQGLIWEIINDERTTFTSSIAPTQKGKNTYMTGGFYDKIIRANVKNEITEKYNLIATKVYNIYYRYPGEAGKKFKSGDLTALDTVSLAWDNITRTYKATITDANSAFTYFEVDTSSGLNVSIDAGKITISSKEAISGTKEVVIKNKCGYDSDKYKSVIYNSNNNSSDLSKTNENYDGQDVITPACSYIFRKIQVQTPQYSLKITKKNSSDVGLDGAEFNVYGNSLLNSYVTTLTTKNGGVATYDQIKNPGIYYIKETKAPEGYELDNKIYLVEVKKDNTGENYAEKTIINDPKKFTISKVLMEDGQIVKYGDLCNGDKEESPVFNILTKDKSETLKFTFDTTKNEYIYDEDGSEILKPCNGKIIVTTLPEDEYIIKEVHSAKGAAIPKFLKDGYLVNVKSSGKKVSFTNGFNGVEFQKKNEDGEFLDGGKYTIQINDNGIYYDTMLKEESEGIYSYDESIDENTGTYFIETKNGTAKIKGLKPGKYRIVEKEAPEGYDLNNEDLSSAFTIGEVESDYQLVTMVDRKTTLGGSEASAELVVTITTGRKVLNYTLIIGGIIIVLTSLIVIRKKTKK